VAYELRFPGSFTFMGNLGKLQGALAEEFPKLQVPHTQLGDVLALQHSRFATPDQLDTVGVAINSFFFSSKRYTVFDEFRHRFLRLLDVFYSVHCPKHFRRLGLRFTNVLPLLPGTIDNLHPWLALGAVVPASLNRPVSECQGAYVLDYDDGAKLRVTTGNAQQNQDLVAGNRAVKMVIDSFLLDFDCYLDGEIPTEEAGVFLDRAHGIIDTAFFDLLTPEGAAQLGGR
jgi:uncharacterized protein (TIGR04255 family)